jgi:hypothetical protein
MKLLFKLITIYLKEHKKIMKIIAKEFFARKYFVVQQKHLDAI